VLGVSSYYIGGKGADAQYGARLSPEDFTVRRLLDRKLALVRGDGMIIFDYPKCKELHTAILSDPSRGLLYRLLHRLAAASDAPGKMVDPDGINGELGLTTQCFAPYAALIKLGLISKHPAHHKLHGVNYTITVTDEAREMVNQPREWCVDAAGHHHGNQVAIKIENPRNGTTPMNTLHDANRAVFINYAHADNENPDPKGRWLDRLLQMLKPLVSQEALTYWSDQDIKIGDNWHARIQDQLAVAKAAVLLVSPAFLASEYIRNSELPVLLKNAADKGVRIFPIIVKPCLYERATFKYPDPKTGPHEVKLSTIQSANPPSKALTEMTDAEQDRVLLKVAEQLHDLLAPGGPASPSPAGGPVLTPLAADILASATANNGQLNYIRYDGGMALVGRKEFNSNGDGRTEAALDNAMGLLIRLGLLKQIDEEVYRVTTAGYQHDNSGT
jgi:hypothetical protein